MKLRKGSLRLLCLLLTVCILASMLPQVVFAATVASGTCGTKVNWTLDDAGTLTITGSGDMDNWGAGYAPWYSGYRDEIKSVVIGNGVTSIGNHAFYYCLNLSGVTISNTVTTINYNAFYQTALKTLEIPDSVTTLGANAFCYCNSLTSVSLGKGVATIGGSAFYQCTNLMEFSVDNDNPNYSSDSFGVLFNKDKTKLIQAPCGINGSYAIPDSVTSIEEAAFAYADLSSLSIGNNVSTIGKMAFWQCAYMTDVTISDSVTSIGSSAFYGCTGLTDVYYKGTQEQWSNISISGSNTPLTNATIYFNPANSGEGGSESESETELVDPSLYPESEHVYGNNLSEEKVFTYPGAEKLIITFSDETEVENKYDKIYLYDCSGNLVKEYTGTEAAGQSVIITGDTFTIKLTSDVSVQKYGYSFSSIIAYMPTITIDPSLYPESKHNYDSNLNETQTFTYPGAKDLTITFSASTEVENSYDKLYLYDGADNLIQQYTGTQAAGQTVTILGDTFKIRLTSDGSVTKYGYSFSSIVARMSGNVKTVTGIEIKALPTKTQYSKGETLDTTGLVLTAIYSDGTTADITDGYTVTGFDSTTAGDKNLKVSYKNCTASFFVSVTLSGSCGTNLSWVLDSEGTLTISGSGNMTNWSGSNTPWYSSRDTIKKVIINDGVYSIGNYAFYNCTNLEEIVMPDFSIDSIGNYAFYNCTSLLTVEMDNGISTVGTGAFYNCTNLSKVVFSYNTYSIGANCFKNCSGLEQVFFTAEPPTFGSTPFVGVVADIYYTEDCGWTDTDRQNYGGTLTWIPAEMGVTSAGKCGNLHWQYSTYLCQLKITGSGAMHSHTSASCCWSDIAADVQKVEIGEGITSIGDYAFYNCTDLWSVTIPDGVTSIGNSAFRGTGVGRVLLPDSCTSIGYYAFSDCTDLFYINLPDSITSIGHHAFSGCGDLESITIPEKITQIPSSAFAGTGLTSVSIPSGVTSIASGAFDACNGLRYILFEGNKPSFSSAFNAVNATVYYPADNSTWTITGSDLLDACGTLTFVAAENNIVASGTYYYGYGQWSVDLFGNLTFDGYGELPTYSNAYAPWYEYRGIIKHLQINARDIYYINSNWFYFLTEMKTMNLRASGALSSNFEIADYAFGGCYSLETAYISNGSSAGCIIGKYAFSNCISLKEIGIPDGATIAEYAFYECNDLDSVYIVSLQGGLSYNFYSFSANENAFAGITANVYYPIGCKPGSKAQNYGGNLTWTEHNTGMCGAAVKWHFDSNTGTLTLSGSGVPDTYWSGNYTPWCNLSTQIRKIVIEEGITELPEYLFEYVTGAETVQLPETLTLLAANAFNDCENLNNILLPSSLKAFSNTHTFNRCNSLTDIYYLGTAEQWAAVENAASATYGYGFDVHVLKWQGRSAACTEPGNSGYYCFDDTSVYPQRYDEDMNITTNVEEYPALGHNYVNSVCDRCGEPVPLIIKDTDGNVVGGFTDLTEALRQMQEGQMVLLQTDVTAADMILPSGVTIDLNGNSLTVDSLLTYSSSAIVDTSEDVSGFLKINDEEGNMISASNSQLPVYDSANGGYRFFAIDVQPCAVTGGNKYWFRVKAEKFAMLYELICADSEVRIKAKMTWDGQTEDAYAVADLAFTKTWAEGYKANGDIYITVSVKNAENLENFKLIPMITSAGVEIPGEEM